MFNWKTLGHIIAQEIVSIGLKFEKAAIKALKIRYKTRQSRILMKLLTDSIRKNTTIDINIFGKSIFTVL